jgi:3-hydroxyacyl-CoA dehydrogenase
MAATIPWVRSRSPTSSGEYGNPRYAPCLEITKRVEAGLLGRKSGRGFYNYRA